MTQHFIFLLLGLANGAVFGSLALALVVTYRSSGVINFATGAMALYTAYTYAFLRQGRLFVPIPGLPTTVDIGAMLGFWAAAAVSLLIAAALGLLLYVLVFRPLRAAPAVARAVASVGVTAVLTGVMLQRLGTSPVEVGPIFSAHTYLIGSVRISADRIWFAVTIVGVALGLAGIFRFTRFGLHTRASAETEKGAYVSGISPSRVAALNWMVSGMVAGLAGILIAPIVPLVPAAYTLFIVPALAAAILARFNYLSIAVLAGIGIGMLQSEVGFLKSQHSFLPSSGLPELVPLVLILLVLVVRARPLPTRGALIQQHLGRAPRPRRLGPSALVGMAVGVVALVALHGSWRAAAVTSLVYGIIALSLVVVTGYAGQVSLAQLTLAGVGAFLLAPLTASWGVPFPFAPLLAALGATIIGVIVGLPAVRIRGLPLAVVTLALAVAVQALWFQNTDIVTSGGKNVSGPSFLGVDLRAHIGAAYPRLGFSIMVLIVVAMVAVGVAKLRTSRLGSAMLAVRANERSAAAAGVNVMWTKLVAFALAAFIAGIGGSMLAYLQGNVTFDPFDVILGLGLFATAYLAGITSVSGGVLAGVLAVGGLVFYASDQWLSLGGDWYQVLTGLGLILTVVLNPEGLVGPIHDGLDRRRWRRAQAEPPREAVPVAPVRPSLAALETAPSTPVLSLCDITVHYGGVTAVSGVSLEINEGDIAGLIGPNGAGKTTLVDAISGFAEASGTVTLDGRRLDHLKPHRRVRAGLGRTFQGIEIWGDLSVGENVMVGVAGAARRDGEAGDGDHQQILDRLHLSEVGDRPAGELSQGQRRLVSIARALVARPRVLILDEPAAGLDSTESQWLGERLRDIRALGTTILVIDHDMSLVLNLCDPIHVLNFGALIASGSPTAIRSDRAVAEAYLGTTGADRSTVTA